MTATAGMPGGDRLTRPVAGRQLGRYEILTQHASGGMASIYIARAQGVAGFERMVAIKVLHPHLAYEQEFISMFLDEARLAARIRHMNVVPTLDISDSPGDGYFLVMEYIEGNHLGALLGRSAKKGERLPRPFVCRVLVDTLQGLGAAHRLTDEHGVPLKLVHRDVSPHNILVGTDGIARITDFGVAKADVRMASTRAGQFKGKLSYMAPEQASSGDTDQRSDLFGVGIILWESLTGRRLFKGDSNAATLNKLLNEEIVPPSKLWADLEPYDALVMKALNRDPSARFQSADEFVEALEATAGRNGIAKTRDVAEVVRSLDADKLQVERQRLREAIETLGRPEFASAHVPMPREGGAMNSQTYSRGGTPGMESSISGFLADGTPVIVRTSSNDSKLLKWLVVLLALLVFMYAGVLVWRLLDDPPPPEAVEPPPQKAAPLVPVPPPAPPPDRIDDKDVSPPTEMPDEVKVAPKPTDDLPRRTRRRKPRPKPRTQAKVKAEPVATETGDGPKKKPVPRPEPPQVEPVDIDIQNPYRN